MYTYSYALKNHIQKFLLPLTAGISMLLFSFLLSMTAYAAETRAVTVSSSNNSLGAVFCTVNGVSFTHYTYAEPADYITVNALPVNKNYNFLNWTDNGVIVSSASTYSFSVKDTNHVLVAHFDAKPELKHERYDADKDISSITHNTSACTFAAGYKIDGMTINTALMPLDETTASAVEAVTGGSLIGAFQIQFTFGYNGTEKQTLDKPARLVLQLPALQTGTCRIVSISSTGSSILEDLDDDPKTITFETNSSGLYAVTDAALQLPEAVFDMPAASGVPAATDVPSVSYVPAVPDAPSVSGVPAVPDAPAAPVTEEQYKDAVIDILRYQLQQAGITPAV